MARFPGRMFGAIASLQELRKPLPFRLLQKLAWLPRLGFKQRLQSRECCILNLGFPSIMELEPKTTNHCTRHFQLDTDDDEHC